MRYLTSLWLHKEAITIIIITIRLHNQFRNIKFDKRTDGRQSYSCYAHKPRFCHIF